MGLPERPSFRPRVDSLSYRFIIERFTFFLEIGGT